MIQQKVKEDDEDCFIFCDKHIELGKRELKKGGLQRRGDTHSNSKRSQLTDALKSKSSAKSKKRVIEEEDEAMDDDEGLEEADVENDA